MKKTLLSLLTLCLFFYSCKSTREVPKAPEEPAVPDTEEIVEPIPEEIEVPETLDEEEKAWNPNTPKNIEEFRAAWIATVANINWPSKPGLSTSAQQKEALELLDFLESHNFNAVVFQVRPQADALYNSEIEPWSYFLTGEQGKAPEPYYDPLKFWINAAHQRGLELHVWLNPYRAHHTTGKEISEKSVIKTNPELVVALENGMWWMDPAQKGTQDRSAAVVMDIVKRYDVDGIHFDDYFYPYDSYNNGKDFPDDKSWRAYQAAGGELSRGDWRRESVNVFIKRIYEEIKAEKPHVKFGLSPFGIWRPGYPESVQGYDQYDKLYADAKLWLNEGWIDYYTPQLYWKISQLGQSFPELLGWWKSENTKQRHLWPGMNVGGDGDEMHITEVINQIMITRGMLPQSKGAVHWSIGPLLKNKELAKAIKEGPYRKKTLVPPSPWLDNTPPEIPNVTVNENLDKIEMTWGVEDDADIKKWVLYFKYETGSWDYKILNSEKRSQSLQKEVGKKKVQLEKIGITSVDRNGNQSEFIEIKIN
ncbi:glycoside hydrolase family 10 protein [Salegentibacter maritimus]|uniref:glycoside hydrolase family 10 protein n=1 Tax=Salegentibacter maritimus TaxID=2794347 RepID=UPI0018E478E2|nr:family 10 glycosylhydrolase [Salegentibacter maritimus]MBI6116125.1 family 10 glycosylhydrolase [Salegentibacter maritimus]